MQFLRTYNHLLSERPITTKAISSGLLFGLGDAAAQLIAEKGDYQVRRGLTMAAIGTVSGSIFHYWYGYLSTIQFGAKWNPIQKALATMVIDQTFFSTTYLSIFLYTLTWIEKGDRSTSAQTVKDKLYPTLLANWKIWPAAQLINFYLVPVPYRVLWANFVGLFWNVILSYLSHSSPHPPKDYDPALSTTADKLPLQQI